MPDFLGTFRFMTRPLVRVCLHFWAPKKHKLQGGRYILTVHPVTHYSTCDAWGEANHGRLAAHELCAGSDPGRAGDSRSSREHYVIWQATVFSFPSLVEENTTCLTRRKPRPFSYLDPLLTRPLRPLRATLLCNRCPSSKTTALVFTAADAVCKHDGSAAPTR